MRRFDLPEREQMADKRMALTRWLEKGSDSDLLREMIGYVTQRLMELDMDGLVGAAHGGPRELAQRPPRSRVAHA